MMNTSQDIAQPIKEPQQDGHLGVPGANLPEVSFFGLTNMESGAGYIKLYRKIFENDAYFAEKFCRNMAWIDLIMLANHKPGIFRVRGIMVTVNRGQVGYGIEKLAERWKWSRGKVERYLNDLETIKQIVRQKNNVTTLITIVNYDIYQSNDNANGKTNGKANGHQTVKQTVKQTDINNNDKNEKNVKNDKKFIAPTREEVEKYFVEKGYRKDAGGKAFDYYNEAGWKDSTGKPVLNWKQKMMVVWFKDENKYKPVVQYVTA